MINKKIIVISFYNIYFGTAFTFPLFCDKYGTPALRHQSY